MSSLRSARNDTQSNLDCTLKNKFCRTGECDVAETFFDFLKADLQFVSAAREDSDWPFAILSGGEDERAGDYSRPTRKRFVFDAAFVGADRDFVRPPFFNEVHICAVW